jgi:hypothetical protein
VISEPSLLAGLYDYFQGLAIDEHNLMNLWAGGPVPTEDEDDEEDE